MFIGVAAAIIMLLVATFFYAKCLEQDEAQKDFRSLRNDIQTTQCKVNALEEGSIQTSDLRDEIGKDIKYADRLQDIYGTASRKSGRISWYLGITAFVVLMLAVLMESYVDYETQQAYNRGALETLKKASQAVQEAISNGQQ
jgi:hypothetical protein